MSDLPDDILKTHILSRLPVKDLLRCRCVLKSWCNLIDSPDFSKIHLKHSKETNSNTGHLVRSEQNEIHWLDLNTLKSLVKLNLPVDRIPYYQVVGSCNGLLALFDFVPCASDNLSLVNPFTRRYIKLPLPNTKDEGKRSIKTDSFGFGYDPIGDDYKLVRISGLYKYCKSSGLDIYSLKSNSWRRVNDFPYLGDFPRDGILVNNALHWMVYPKEPPIASQLILAFDLVSEEYRLVPIPHNDHKNRTGFEAGTLGGCLCINYIWGSDWKYTDVWVMKEYGVKESWTKLFSVSDFCCPYSQSVTYWKTSDKVMLMNDIKREYIIYDLKTERVKSVDIPIPFELLNCHPKTCVQSLVGLNDGWEIIKEGEISPRRRSNDGGGVRIKRRKRCSQLGR